MAKKIRSLVKGARKVSCPVGVQNPDSPKNRQRAEKVVSLMRERKVVVFESQVNELAGKGATARQRKKIVKQLRKVKV